jgi:hypothetical protein
MTTTTRKLCAHADTDGKGMHWLEAGERCPAAAVPAISVGGSADPAGMTTTTIEPTKLPTCPVWCLSGPDHESDAKNPPLHRGPRFGPYIEIQRMGDGPTVIDVYGTEGEDMYVEDLRQLASDALAAAEWLEAQR